VHKEPLHLLPDISLVKECLIQVTKDPVFTYLVGLPVGFLRAWSWHTWSWCNFRGLVWL